jgi:hypothetical protein
VILYGHSADVAAFVARLIPGCERGFIACQAIGFLGSDGVLEAGVVYHNWNPESQVIELSAASLHRKWVTRERLRAIFDYPFSIGCRLAISRQSEHNTRARRIWCSLGSDEYVIPALRSPTEAEVICVLTKEKWHSSKFRTA